MQFFVSFVGEGGGGGGGGGKKLSNSPVTSVELFQTRTAPQ